MVQDYPFDRLRANGLGEVRASGWEKFRTSRKNWIPFALSLSEGLSPNGRVSIQRKKAH